MSKRRTETAVATTGRSVKKSVSVSLGDDEIEDVEEYRAASVDLESFSAALRSLIRAGLRAKGRGREIVRD